MKYTGNSDGVSRTGAREGTLKLIQLCGNRWGFTNMGSFSNRQMNNPKAKKGDPKWLSVHATGRACDLGYKNRADAEEAWDWFVEHANALGIEEIHDYAYDPNVKDKVQGWGRGYRCQRKPGEPLVKVYNESDNAGSRGGHWLHLELCPAMADNAQKFEAVWRSLPKPA